MTDKLIQLYQAVAKDIIPYPSEQTNQMALIKIDPALPCLICTHPAHNALIAPAPEHSPGESMAWLTFPICTDCETRQFQHQASKASA